MGHWAKTTVGKWLLSEKKKHLVDKKELLLETAVNCATLRGLFLLKFACKLWVQLEHCPKWHGLPGNSDCWEGNVDRQVETD